MINSSASTFELSSRCFREDKTVPGFNWAPSCYINWRPHALASALEILQITEARRALLTGHFISRQFSPGDSCNRIRAGRRLAHVLIHSQTSVGWQRPSRQQSRRLRPREKESPPPLPVMPFQHVAAPQNEKPQLYHWLRFTSLAGFFPPPPFFFQLAVVSLGIQTDKDGGKRSVASGRNWMGGGVGSERIVKGGGGRWS